MQESQLHVLFIASAQPRFSLSFENTRFQSVLCTSPSARWVDGGWSDVPRGARSPLWAPGLPGRHLNQTEPPNPLRLQLNP